MVVGLFGAASHGVVTIVPLRKSAQPWHVPPLDDDDDDEDPPLDDDEDEDVIPLDVMPLDVLPPLTGGGSSTPSALGPCDSPFPGPGPSTSIGNVPPEHATKSPVKATAVHQGFIKKALRIGLVIFRSLTASVRNNNARERNS